MKHRILNFVFMAGASAAVTLSAPATADIGVRAVIAQSNAATAATGEALVVADNPRIVSDALKLAWWTARPQMCIRLQQEMRKPRAIARETLRNVECRLSEDASFEVVPFGPGMLRANIAIRGPALTATVTQPTQRGRYADPDIALEIDGRLAVNLAVTGDGGKALRVVGTSFELSRASVSARASAPDVQRFVDGPLTAYFAGPDYRRLAENAVNRLSRTFTGQFEIALSPVNDVLKAPAGYAALAVSASSNRIMVSYAPREDVRTARGTAIAATPMEVNFGARQ